MELWQIDKAVNGLCEEVEKIVHRIDFIEMTEAQLVNELLVCILGSGVRYEISVAYAAEILQSDFLYEKKILNDEIQLPIEGLLRCPVQAPKGDSVYKKHRYPERGAKFISQSLLNIYTEYGSLKNFIGSNLDKGELRRS